MDSNYVRWRLTQVMGVSQQSSFPVLFNYRFPVVREDLVVDMVI